MFKLLADYFLSAKSILSNLLKAKGLFKSLTLCVTNSTSETRLRKHHLCSFSIGEVEERNCNRLSVLFICSDTASDGPSPRIMHGNTSNKRTCAVFGSSALFGSGRKETGRCTADNIRWEMFSTSSFHSRKVLDKD